MLLIVLIIHLNVIRGHQVFGHGLEFFRVFLTRLPWFHLIRFELKIFVYSYTLASYVPFRIESAVFGSCHLVIIFVKSNWAESIFDQFGNSFSKSSIILESITNAGRRGYSFKRFRNDCYAENHIQKMIRSRRSQVRLSKYESILRLQ